MAYNIIIKSGLLFDGGKKTGVRADIGIQDETIAAIGNLEKQTAKTVIDATGKYVTPGFIDITNHSDTHLTLFKYPNLESLLMQGITTIIGGNCGTSLAPLGNSVAIHAVEKWANLSEINVNWTSIGEYLEMMEAQKLAVNYGTFVGYGTIRRGIIENEARLFKPEELESAKLLLLEGLEQGAYGLSLGLSYGHENVSTSWEIIDVASILKKKGGILKIHLRSEGKELIASINEVLQIGRETGVSIEISHLKALGKRSWPSFKSAVELLERAYNSGLDINFDISPYSSSGSPLYLFIPLWARQGGFAELFKKLEDNKERQKIIDYLIQNPLHYEKILIISAKMASIVGKTLAEIAKYSGLTPEETLLDTIIANEGRVATVGRTVAKQNTEFGIQNSLSFISSDGAGFSQDMVRSGNLVHPRSFGAFPHFWHRFVTDLKIIPPEEAIHKIASGPAEKLNLKGRGKIAKGSFADVVVFDPRIFQDRATYKNPFRYPAGIEWVTVNGQITVENGRYIEARAGKVLRKT